jgi:23S rRNA (uracil1939-C5)-methyltransferase
VLVTLVINMRAANEDEFDRSPLGQKLQKAAEDIRGQASEIVGVCVNLNSDQGNKILGDQTFCLSGVPRIEEVLKSPRQDYPELLQGGIEFSLSSTSFFQVNTEQAVRLLESVYDSARDALSAVEKPVIVDAFAGVGTMALWLSPLAARVIAVEEHAAAVEDGRRNAQKNGITNVEFVLGTVESILPDLYAQGVAPHLIVLDPPRKGLSQEAIVAVRQFSPPRLIYVSCNPTTLARDLKILAGGDPGKANIDAIGYKTKQIQPVDLFPQTYHVESVTTLERQLSDGPVGNLETA